MNEENLSDTIRNVTEADDLSGILKSSFGGYSKKSVRDYQIAVQKQQTELANGYREEIELLRSALDDVRQEKVDALAAQKQQLTQAAEDREAELKEDFDNQFLRLQLEKEELHEDLVEARSRAGEQSAMLRKLENQLAAAQQMNEMTKQDVSTGMIQLETANHKIAELERQLDAKAGEIRFHEETEQKLRDALEEDTTSGLFAQIQELMGKIELLQNEVALRDQELDNRAKRLETLSIQDREHHSVLEDHQTQIIKLTDLNEWLSRENDELGQRLKNQMEEHIAISRECARLKAANAIMQRKLDTGLTVRPLPEQMKVRPDDEENQPSEADSE